MKRIGMILALGSLAAVALTASASASSGSFTTATANAEWTKANISGSVTYSGCSTSPCSWIPFVIVKPSLPSYSCARDDWESSDRNIRTVWNGGSRTGNGSATFALADVSILSGVFGQRACLNVVRSDKIRDPICVAQAPIFGYDPNTCGFIDRITGEVIANRTLQVGTSPAPDPTPDPGPDPMTLQEAVKKAKGLLARKYGRSWKRGKKKRVTCVEKTSSYTCRGTWTYKNKKRRGVVSVSRV